MVRGDHRAQGIHRPREGLGAQWRGHFGRPVVVRVGAVKGVRVGKGLHELGSESVLKVGRSHSRRVHRIPLALTPLGPTVLEPHLVGRREKGLFISVWIVSGNKSSK